MMDVASLPTGRRGQAAALGAALALILLAWFGMAAPLAGWYADRADEIERQTLQVEHLSAVAGRLPALEAQVAASAHGSGHTLDVATDARAGADLQRKIEDMANAAGCHPSSIEFLAPEQADGYRRIALRIAVTARWPALITLMSAIETAAPALLIDDLHVRAAGSDGDPTPPAEANFVVIMLRSTPPRAAAAPAGQP